MAIRTFDAVPQSFGAVLVGNAGIFTSALTGGNQIIARAGVRWQVTHSWSSEKPEEFGQAAALAAFAKGGENQCRLRAYGPEGGNGGGSPSASGGNAGDNTLSVNTGAGTDPDWMKAGDFFSVSVNGEHELKQLTQDAPSSGGNATLVFEPPLRGPASGAVWIGYGGTKPQGVFYLQDSAGGQTQLTPGRVGVASLVFIEDIWATIT